MLATADRNLLVGLVALKRDMIDRCQLIEAAESWLLDRSRRLDDILVNQHALSVENRQLLERLVDQQIERLVSDAIPSLPSSSDHGNAAKALNNSDDEESDDTFTRGEHDVLPEISELTNNHSLSTRANYSRGADSERRDELRFQILRPHAKGGLGEVSIAKDIELNREVALKEIQSKYADDPGSRMRFLLEAEITGSLEHPGIVPVYGLGRYFDGRPYYAMRFVKGESFQEAVDRLHGNVQEGGENGKRNSESRVDFSSIEFRKLLGRFIDVCQAIDYAHSKGVLHRDLKPSNIMLGEFGETLVVDWGLAKSQKNLPDLLGQESSTLGDSRLTGGAHTEPGSVIGTPAYMSPEQASGKTEEIGPISDVFSLGATLYYLLTGRAPFPRGNLPEVLKQVREGRFELPRALCPGVPRPLEMICLCAMSVDSNQRYATARELANEVERFLADEPVEAYREPVTLRMRRWVRRHQTLTSTLAAAILLSILGLLLFSMVIGGKNAELTKLNIQLDGRNDDLDATVEELRLSNQKEQTARQDAESSAAIAREQSELALSTMKLVINNIQSGIKEIPGAGSIRAQLLSAAIGGLEGVADQFIAKSQVDVHSARALRELGDTILLFGTADVDAGDGVIDDTTESATDLSGQLYQRAYEICQMRLALNPDDFFFVADLSASLERMGDIQFRSGQLADSVDTFTQCAQIRGQLVESHPRDLIFRHNQSVALSKLADVLLRIGDVSAAETAVEEALEIDRGSVDAESDNLIAWRDLANHMGMLGQVSARQGDASRALKLFTEAISTHRQILTFDQPHSETRRDIAVDLICLAEIYLANSQFDEAVAAYEESFAIRKELQSEDPSNLRSLRDLAVGYGELGRLKFARSQFADALKDYRESLTLTQKLATMDPSDWQAKRDILTAQGNIALAFESMGEFERSLAEFEQARDLVDSMIFENPQDVSLTKIRTILQQGVNRSVGKSVMIGDWSNIEHLDENDRLLVLYLCVTKLLDAEKLSDAAAVLAKWDERTPSNPSELHLLASGYGRHVKVSRQLIEEPTAEDLELEQLHIEGALRALKSAIDAGFSDIQTFAEYEDFEVLRGLPEFEALIREP